MAGAGFCWYQWYTFKTALDAVPKEDQLEEDTNLVKNWLIYAGVASGVMVIALLILLIMRKRIALVVQLFRWGHWRVRCRTLLCSPVPCDRCILLICSGLVIDTYSYLL